MHSKSKKLWLDLKIAILCRRFLLDILCYLTSGRTQPAGRNFCWGITPAHLARHVRASLGMYLVYVVEGHASACPQTVGVDVKYVALTLIKLKYYVSASIMKLNNLNFYKSVTYIPINTIC